MLLKTSQDLRRDQLITSLIQLMDMLLKREGVDLKIITYRVTATSHDQARLCTHAHAHTYIYTSIGVDLKILAYRMLTYADVC